MTNENDIVTKEEIDALLNILDDNSTPPTKKGNHFEKFNFNRELLSDKRKFLLLERVHKEFKKIFLQKIEEINRRVKFSSKIISIKDNFLNPNIDNTLLKYNLLLTMINTKIKFYISNEAVNSIVDIFLGGDGTLCRDEKIGDIENSIFRYFLKIVKESLEESWSIENIDKIGKIEDNSSFEKSIKVKIEFQNFKMILSYPSDRIDTISLKLNNIRDTPSLDSIEKIDNLDISLNFLIGYKDMSLESIKKLKEGDILDFNLFKESEKQIVVNSKLLFLCKLNNQKAIITKELKGQLPHN